MRILILARISWGVLLSSRILCLATSPAPYSAQFGLLGKVAARMRLQPLTGRVGLDVLERVASGRADEVTDGSGAQVGLQPGALRNPDFKAATVRA